MKINETKQWTSITPKRFLTINLTYHEIAFN